MKKILLFLLLIINISSCKKDTKIHLYSFNYDNYLPLLNIDQYNKLIKLEASFPLLVYSPKCASSCSLFTLYLNNYLKEENVFFPIIYESVISKEENIFSGDTYLCIYNKGKIIKKEEISYFNDNEISDFINTYSYKNNVNIICDLSFFVKEDELSLANIISYHNDSKLNKELVKNNEILIINDSLLSSFDTNYYQIIKNYKYIYFSSLLNDIFYSSFNVIKNENIYSKLYFSDDKYILEGIN